MVNPLTLFDLTSGSVLIKLIGAIALLLIGFIVARILSKLVLRVLHELEMNRILKEQANVTLPVEEFLSAATKYLVYFIALIMALAQLGLQTVVLYILLTLILVILVAFIILAFKDLIPNVTAGFVLHQKRLLKVGDRIKVKDTDGTVLAFTLTETRLKLKNGDEVLIPNALLLRHEIIKKKR